MIEHGLDDEPCVLVAVIDALQYLAHVVGAEVGVQSSLSCDALQQLLL